MWTKREPGAWSRVASSRFRVPTALVFEIIKGNGGGAVVAGLCCGVDDGIRAESLQQGANTGPVADVQFVVNERRQGLLQPLLVPTGVALRSEKHRALIIVHAVDLPAEFAPKMHADFGANQA